MEATVICSQGKTSFFYDGSESGLWMKVGQLLKWIQAPDRLMVESNGQLAELEVGETIKPLSNKIQTRKSRYEKKYMALVDPKTNSYSFYKITPNNMGPRTLSVGGSFGRMGAKKGELAAETIIRTPYPSFMYWIRYYEKLNQGYRDMGDVMFGEDKTLQMFQPTEAEMPYEENVVLSLYKKLRGYAKDAVSSQVNVNFLSENPPFTKKQVEKGWKIWKSLGESKSVDEFNAKLQELLILSPRKIDAYRGMTVKSLLATTEKTMEAQQQVFSNIITREENLLRAMEAVTPMNSAKQSKPKPFGDVEITLASEEDVNMIKGKLSSELVGKVTNVYRIIPGEQQKRFNEYVKNHNIQNIKYFWHGSRNENWISIIKNSLMLNPNAVITGKMWGNGIYFAPSSMKSWGYTSRGKWTGGNEKTVYMGLYATAYGNPYFPTSLIHGTKDLLEQNHADCIHASANVANLYNDEVIFFDEDALCIQYLVEFEEE